MPTFTLNNEILENVSNYKYLVIIIHKNGKFNKAISERMTKGNCATHMIKQIIGKIPSRSVIIYLLPDIPGHTSPRQN